MSRYGTQLKDFRDLRRETSGKSRPSIRADLVEFYTTERYGRTGVVSPLINVPIKFAHI